MAIKTLLKAAVTVAVLAGVGFAGFAGWRMLSADPEIKAADVKSTPELVERGLYLTRAADCEACHTVPGGKPYAGGVAFKLPFGTIYSTNITPDRETGIGDWSDDDFVRAVHKGVAKDGSRLYPAFPYASYTAMTRDDAVAIKAYLFSLDPTNAPDTPNTLSFPFNQRWAMAFWNVAFLDNKRFRADPALSAQQNRGAYLATALGHCGECHTPRNVGFALDHGREFAGAEIKGWKAYNITSDHKAGIGRWSAEDLKTYFQTGHASGKGSAAGPMAEVVAYSTRHLTDPDLDALTAYLKQVKPQAGDPKIEVAAAAPAAMAKSSAAAPAPGGPTGLGKRIFEGACASCHQWDGKGQQIAQAGLAGLRSVNDPSGVNLSQALIGGADLTKVHSAAFMPGFGAAYTDEELAAVTNYVIGHFGGKAGAVTPADIAERRAQN